MFDSRLRVCLVLVLGWAMAGSGEGAAQTPAACADEQATSVIWLANASPVNFGDLDEVIELEPPPGETLKEALLRWRYGRDVYEGFFEPYREGAVQLPWPANPQESCLTPEAEWVLVFPRPQAARAKMERDEWGVIEVELRGMMEGKHLELLTADSCPPPWKPASGGNNVVASVGMGPYTLEELECRLMCDTEACPSASAPCRPIEARIEISSGDQGLFWSRAADIRRLLERVPGPAPLTQLVRGVFGRHQQRYGRGSAVLLKAIDLSALRAQAALVNDPDRRHRAERALGISRFFRAVWDSCLKARVMQELAVEAVGQTRRPYCLGRQPFHLNMNGSAAGATLEYRPVAR